MSNCHPGCVRLCLTLTEIHHRWIKITMEHIRQKNNPELFLKNSKHSISIAEQNNEISGIAGWAVKSSFNLLNSYNVLEDQVEEIYKP